ncbi:MAG: uncharacterized protein JWN98_1199 [Abditibacteriota bacterium]|nr:uncharacterized protein [Abditibacteriota bacterium]
MTRLWFWIEKILGWTRLRRVRALVVAGVVVWLQYVLARLWTEHNWLSPLALDAAWRVPFAARLQLFIFAFVTVLAGAVAPLRALLPRSLESTLSPVGAASGTLEVWAEQFRRLARRAAWLLVVLVAVRAGMAMAAQWPQWLLWKQGPAWGARDPYFHLDLGFWAFRLPFWTQLHATIWKVVGVLWLLCVVLALGGEIVRLTQRAVEPPRRARAMPAEAITARVWVGVLGALWFTLLAVSYGLAVFHDGLALQPALVVPLGSPGLEEIELPGRTLVPAGYGFTSWWVQRPANFAGVLLSWLVALLWLGFAASARRLKSGRLSKAGARRTALPGSHIAGLRWLGWSSAAAYLLPGALSWLLSILVQRWIVEPDEAWRERPFLQAHIAMQRLGWQLDTVQDVSLRPLPIANVSTPAIARSMPQVLLWNEAALSSANQTATSFGSAASSGMGTNSTTANAGRGVAITEVSLGRYEVSVGVAQRARRELWAVRVSEDRDEGHAPRPRDRVEAFSLSQPRAVPQSTLNGGSWDGGANAGQVPGRVPGLTQETTLACALLQRGARLRAAEADGGVPVQSWAPRAVWAWRLRLPWLLWARSSGDSETHLWVQRDVMARAAVVAPFLTPGDVSAVLINNRLVWIVDLLASTTHLPGALGLQEIERGILQGAACDAAKMVVDAQSGETRLFVADARAEAHPLLRAWRGAFPGLLRPFAEMPQAVREHRLYPRALLARQLMWLERYHDNGERAAETWIERERWWQAARDHEAETASAEAATAGHDLAMIDIAALESRVPAGQRLWVQQAVLYTRDSSALAALLQAGSGDDEYGRLRLLRFNRPLPAHAPVPRRGQTDNVSGLEAPVAAGSNELDASQRVKWRLQRGKVLVALLPAAPVARARGQRFSAQALRAQPLSVHVVMLQSVFRVATSREDQAAQADIWPLWRVLAADATQPQHLAGLGRNVEQAWRDWAGATQAPELELPADSLRRALQWHEQAEVAAKSGDWARAGALRQRQRELLQRLLQMRAGVPMAPSTTPR